LPKKKNRGRGRAFSLCLSPGEESTLSVCRGLANRSLCEGQGFCRWCPCSSLAHLSLGRGQTGSRKSTGPAGAIAAVQQFQPARQSDPYLAIYGGHRPKSLGWRKALVKNSSLGLAC